MLRRIAIVLVAVIVLIVGSFCFFTFKKPALDDKIRSTLNGSFVRLSRGVVHYELGGPEDGPVVVLVHGFTTPYFIWDKTFPALVDTGFRVLRYDLYGRGFSDRPRTNYDLVLFDGQLLELIRTLDLKTPVHLLGLSMGGAVCVTFTDRHPELVSKLGLIAPLSFPQEEPFVRKLGRMPLIGDYIMAAAGEGILKSGVEKSLYHIERFPEFMGLFDEQLKYRGYKEAILSTLRHLRYEPVMIALHNVGKQDRPILLIWGKKDEVIPFSMCVRVRATLPKADLIAVDDGGPQRQLRKTRGSQSCDHVAFFKE